MLRPRRPSSGAKLPAIIKYACYIPLSQEITHCLSNSDKHECLQCTIRDQRSLRLEPTIYKSISIKMLHFICTNQMAVSGVGHYTQGPHPITTDDMVILVALNSAISSAYILVPCDISANTPQLYKAHAQVTAADVTNDIELGPTQIKLHIQDCVLIELSDGIRRVGMPVWPTTCL